MISMNQKSESKKRYSKKSLDWINRAIGTIRKKYGNLEFIGDELDRFLKNQDGYPQYPKDQLVQLKVITPVDWVPIPGGPWRLRTYKLNEQRAKELETLYSETI